MKKRSLVNLIIGVIVLFVVLSVGMAIGNKGGMSETEELSFERKKECASYLDEINERVISKTSEGQISSYHELDEIWYSQTLNTCLYSLSTVITFADSDDVLYSYSIHDYLGGKDLDIFTNLEGEKDNGKDDNAYSEFLSAKGELK